MKIRLIFILLFGITVKLWSQQTISGFVHDKDRTPLINVQVYWKLARNGVVTDTAGMFSIPLSAKEADTLVFRMVGYRTEYFQLESGEYDFELSADNTLKGATIDGSQPGMVMTESVGIQSVITAAGLRKSACCNLAEAFETNGAVDVSFSDAVTGAKQIRLLGLDGKYVPITFEGLPNLRGLASLYGLSYIPGPFIENISVSKGTGSVTLGYESMTGQINVEYKKPFEMERLHVNGYFNSMTRSELNLVASHRFKKGWSTALFAHGNIFRMHTDRNKDGFLDMPFAHQVNLSNRWVYTNEKTEFQAGIKYVWDVKEGGQGAYYRHQGHSDSNSYYRFFLETHRAEAWLKNGFFWKNKPYKSLAYTMTFIYHDQRGSYGLRPYTGRQTTGYFNSIYQSIIVNTNHKFKTGLSFLYDKVDERFATAGTARTEYVPGVYGEYTFRHREKLDLVAGLRYDYHNLYKHQVTPRLQLKVTPVKDFSLKLSGGRGFRSPNVFADNAFLLVSNRQVLIPATLKPEVSWNGGGGAVYRFQKGKVSGSIGADYFYTWFQNQLIPNMETAGLVVFENVGGASYAHAFQLDFMLEPLKRLQFHLNAKWNNVRSVYNGQRKAVPFIPVYKGLLNVAYSTGGPNPWSFDATVQLNGPARLPLTYNPGTGEANRTRSPVYALLFAQVSKKFRNWEVYIGGENLTDYRQPNPLIDPQNPGSASFDASQVWAPVFGAMAYGGFRYTLKYK